MITKGSRLPDHVIAALSAGDPVSDFEFDQCLPSHLQDISDVQWSSVKVARVIAHMLRDSPSARFIDLGCGVGKLCVILALMTELEVFGIERRANLVRIAQQLVQLNAPGGATIIRGDILDLDWNQYDVFYLYNPFYEHQCNKASANLIDSDIQLGEDSFRKYIGGIYERLCSLKPEQRVITYHGYGGMMPELLQTIETSRVGDGTVKVWANINK